MAAGVAVPSEMTCSCLGSTLTRFAALSTLSRSAGEGPEEVLSKPLSRTAGEGGPSLKGLVGEGYLA
jgi:hypothetical protein